jgi:hypothetical protein
MLEAVGDILRILGLAEIYLSSDRLNAGNLTRLEDTLSLLDLRALVDGHCTSIHYSASGRNEMCLYCAWKGCPDNPEANDYCLANYWLQLNANEQMFVQAVFQDGYVPEG